ncbi:MAG: hypothetical protein FD124_3318 [Alphaproteobacteria bacterium]|nr:MAG: hypothetical protein FD160_20 [Caulobacteraceae bacterium]TPW02665.1 MAG: hypothetical protein FD124_3318 [Alphaproteobacteria bacterium]
MRPLAVSIYCIFGWLWVTMSARLEASETIGYLLSGIFFIGSLNLVLSICVAAGLFGLWRMRWWGPLLMVATYIPVRTLDVIVAPALLSVNLAKGFVWFAPLSALLVCYRHLFR